MVLPGDGGGQLGQLGGREPSDQASAQLLGHDHRCAGHRYGQVEHQPFVVVEGVALLVAREILELAIGDTELSANGRAEIQSKWASDQPRCLYTGQLLESGRELPGDKRGRFVAEDRREESWPAHHIAQ